MHGEIVQREHGDSGDLRRVFVSGRGDAELAHQVSICVPEG